MKKGLMILATVLILSGCNPTPTTSEVETLINDKHGASILSNYSKLVDFKKTNGFEKSANEYIADISYSIEMIKDYKELDKAFRKEKRAKMKGKGTSELYVVMINLAAKYEPLKQFGKFKNGQSKEFSEKITLLKTENGWEIEGNI